MHDPYEALYLHLPFCKQRCGYCDFETQAIAVDDPSIDEYVDNMILEIRAASRNEKLGGIKTVYVGGGTPSYAGTARLSKLLYALSVSMHLTSEVECTMEANPESLTEAMVKDIWALGVNRLSLGVQSLNDDLLKTLGRPHDQTQALRAIEIAQTRFDNVSIDMMCSIPGQTEEQLEADLRKALESGIKHVSMYPLTIEENTPFELLVNAGAIKELDQDKQASMMQVAQEVLESAGLMRYEVASYAQTGYESRHNKAYWTGKPYIGFGTSAVTMTQNNERRMRIQDDQVVDDLDREQMCAEDLMLGMRMTQGISDDQVEQASLLLPEVFDVFHELIRVGLVEHEEGRYRPTQRGWLCGNELYSTIFSLAP